MQFRSVPRAPTTAAARPRTASAARWLLCGILLAGCKRSVEEWVLDLRSADPWHRRMSAVALGRADDRDCEHAFRALVVRMRDDDSEVEAAIEGSLRALAARRPDLAAKALAALAPERVRYRSFLARVVSELARAGSEEVRPALREYLEVELASGVDARVQAALALQREFGVEAVPSTSAVQEDAK